MTPPDAEVGRWATELLGTPVDIEPLAGGANNHLFRCRGPRGTLVIKRYREQNFGAEVSRREAEVAFLRHAAVLANRFVPALLAVHESQEMIAMTAIEGHPYVEGEPVPAAAVRAALQFYRDINADRDRVRRYPLPAREGYLSITAHIAHIEGRVAGLGIGHLPGPLQPGARAALDRLRENFDLARRHIVAAITHGELDDAIGREQALISPGDFGFHNALCVNGAPIFLDFEYAGFDDPAKTLADLFLQPRVPIDPGYFDEAAEAMALRGDTSALKRRAAILGRLLAAKWQAIILAPLDERRYPAFSSRYADRQNAELLRRVQLSLRETRFG